VKHFSVFSSLSQRGGVVLEYLLITLFATILTVSLLGASAQIFREKIEKLAEQAGVKIDSLQFNPFAGIDGRK
jgi:hypothetical protein